MIEQLALIVFGIIVGSVLGVEYSMWRAGRKLKHYEELGMSFLGINPTVFKKLSREGKVRRIAIAIQDVWELASPQQPIPTPSEIATFNGKLFFVPICPQCGYAAASVPSELGEEVEAVCPTHGVFYVMQPPKPPENEKEE